MPKTICIFINQIQDFVLLSKPNFFNGIYNDVFLLTQEISKMEGIVWILAGLLFMVAALLFIFQNRRWLYFGLASVVISQTMIFMHWQYAKLGSIANVFMLVAIIFGTLQLGYMNRYKAERDMMLF